MEDEIKETDIAPEAVTASEAVSEVGETTASEDVAQVSSEEVTSSEPIAEDEAPSQEAEPVIV